MLDPPHSLYLLLWLLCSQMMTDPTHCLCLIFWRLCSQMLAPPHVLAPASLAVVLADARPPAMLAPAFLAVLLTDARPVAFLARASFADVLAHARPPALLALASQRRLRSQMQMLTVAHRPHLLYLHAFSSVRVCGVQQVGCWLAALDQRLRAHFATHSDKPLLSQQHINHTQHPALSRLFCFRNCFSLSSTCKLFLQKVKGWVCPVL